MKEYGPSFLHNKNNTIESTPTNGYDLPQNNTIGPPKEKEKYSIMDKGPLSDSSQNFVEKPLYGWN